MTKNVIISVRGTQALDNNDLHRLELVTEGKYYKKGGAYYVTYKESEVTGMEGTTTTLKIIGGTVTLMRFGAVNSHFIFERGQKHFSYYDTSFGTFTIGVFANEVRINVNDDGGEIWVDYELEIDNNKSGVNDFYMFIREAGHFHGEHDRKCETGN
ncbi:MAG: DUF1934 domain-containing protein [Clostridiales bacterium]|jgi:uncharacterized beta-barrel protein YwiB (DUF1934 family)|nr:DUF1934 domain-containing protein [Eubacteriales bacterium]MDH7566463.1 DUF1934 domain-containing protein [Clostridiales bacterium]